ncbi:hypothetical protein JCM6882_006486 [Rhodosporidiobolus microsporus]
MAAPSTSYSSLLRRSKLAHFNPQIDQVYTTSSANLARSNFGFKRPLPQATTKTSPFVRVSHIDSPEGRTVFRKATRETKFVRQWSETGVGIQSEAFHPRSAHPRKWDRLELQSRFVAGSGPGAVKPVTSSAVGATAVPRMPNVFALSEGDFDRFLEELGERRDEFKAFVVAEMNKTNNASQPASVDDFDLYDHAQRHPTELIRLVERFLRLPSPSTASLTSAPLPQIHPTLALQYASPTPLESALAPPVRGRVLGPVPEKRTNTPGGNTYGSSSRFDMFASVLSTVTTVSNPGSSAAPTTFFPDAAGVRSNAPGRASFRLNPVLNPVQYALRAATESPSSLGRKSATFRPDTAEYEPATLALRALDARASVLPAEQARAAVPGTPAYSGDLPADAAQGGFGGRLRGGAVPTSMADMFAMSTPGGRSAARTLGYRQPQNLVAARKNRRTREQQEQWVRQREGLLQATQAEVVKEGKQAQQAQRRKQNQGKNAQANRNMLDRLDSLLSRK